MATEKQLVYLDDIKDALRSVSEDTTCPVHIAAEIDQIVELAPTVDAVEVVHSQWDTVFYERNGTLASYSHLCPECKYFYKNVRFKGHNYCPNCGAKMDGDGND